MSEVESASRELSELLLSVVGLEEAALLLLLEELTAEENNAARCVQETMSGKKVTRLNVMSILGPRLPGFNGSA